MSRVGKNPVALPKGVEINLGADEMVCKGPKGQMTAPRCPTIDVAIEDGRAVFTRTDEGKHSRAMHGTMRALVANMVKGVSEGFSKKLEIIGVGYRAQLQGKKLVLNIGFCHPVEIEAPEGIDFNVPDQTHIEVSGVDKQRVGQTAAVIRAVRKPEPYKGKGIRYEGERVRRKAGKAAK
jgi:large subunit ribosomal protein L6